jgi:exosortase H (IPTLxxWG-CTERM-specific)
VKNLQWGVLSPMSHRKRERHKHFSSAGLREERQKTKSIFEAPAGWFSQHKPVFLFLLIFGVLMGLFYAFAIFTPFYERHFPYYLGFNARLSGYILKFLGQDITVRGVSISSPAFSITVKQGCDAIEPTALFICAVLAFPAAFPKKIAGIVAGTLLLAILNLVRIVTLFLVGLYLPSVFELMHADVWQGLFIFIAILFWVLWLVWTGKSQVLEQNPQG